MSECIVNRMADNTTDFENVQIKPDTKAQLRMFKAKHGITYDEAVQILLKNSGWGFDDE